MPEDGKAPRSSQSVTAHSTSRPATSGPVPGLQTNAPAIPIIDLGKLVAATRPSNDWRAAVDAVAAEIDKACRDTGFFYIGNHGVPLDLTEAVLDANRDFHARPEAEKLALKLNAWHRGYQPMASTQMHLSARFAPAPAPNQLESFIIREDVPPEHPDYKVRPFVGPNQWPDDKGFRRTLEAYYDTTRALAIDLLPALSVAVGERADFFDAFFDPPGATLRLVHYPPTPAQRPEDFMGIYPHTDYGFITILAQDDVGGLEIQRVDGTWVEAPAIPGTFVVNIGDTVARWTNDTFNSSPHRVINKSTVNDRYSVALFFDPNYDATIRCLDSFIPDGSDPKYPPIDYAAYYQGRMDRNHPDRRSAD